MNSSHYGAGQTPAMNVWDVTKPGSGVHSDLITDNAAHPGSWFAVQPIGLPGAQVVVTVLTDTIKTLNGVPPSVAAGSFIVGQTYKILSVGATDFTLVGAATNNVGVTFLATGVGTGSGTAMAEGRSFVNVPLPVGGPPLYGQFQSIQIQSGTVIAYRNSTVN